MFRKRYEIAIKVHTTRDLTGWLYVKGKNVDKSRNTSFWEDHRLGKYLTNVVRYLIPLKIAYARADRHNALKLKQKYSLIYGHFAHTLL